MVKLLSQMDNQHGSCILCALSVPSWALFNLIPFTHQKEQRKMTNIFIRTPNSHAVDGLSIIGFRDSKNKKLALSQATDVN